MRLWTLHPQYLDARGLVAVWREALLARAVLRGRTRGYRFHPQLARFRAQPDPVACLNTYLRAIYDEAVHRGYHFDASKLGRAVTERRLAETAGQLAYEWAHLKTKLRTRSPVWYRQLVRTQEPVAHPLFRIRPGCVQGWERSIKRLPRAGP